MSRIQEVRVVLDVNLDTRLYELNYGNGDDAGLRESYLRELIVDAVATALERTGDWAAVVKTS